MSNNLTNLRNIKLLNEIKKAGDFGFFDFDLAEKLGWKLIATRAALGSLRNRGEVTIIDTTKGWYVCYAEEIENEIRPGKDKKTRGKA